MDVGGCLLLEDYRDYITTEAKKLLVDTGLFGHGATIVKCPLTNILFAGKHYCLDNLICSLMMVSNNNYHSI